MPIHTYICDRCLKHFTNKYLHERHLSKKRPCKVSPNDAEIVNIQNTVISSEKKSKSQLGQFYTTNYDYILQNMEIPETVNHIIEPFAGNGDLLNFIKHNKQYTMELYDIDPKYENTIKRDTLNDPPCYDNKFVLTNPPYLARNKNANKELYDKYDCNDLYKCFILNLINSSCLGGIIIIPLNFISSIRKADIDLRKSFLEKFNIKLINIFEEQVFNDTSYAVCSIFFELRTEYMSLENLIEIHIYPSKKIMNISLTGENNYTIGGEIYNLPINTKCKIERATKLTLIKNKEDITNIMLKCIDDNIDSQLGFKIVSDEERFIDTTEKLSARSYATLVINRRLTLTEQSQLVERLNSFIADQREKYNSLFLTNYRESNSIARKRISFELAFQICNYILNVHVHV